MSDPCLVEGRPAYTQWDWHICRDEDWYDPLPQIFDENGNPQDMSGRGLYVYVRPPRDHVTCIKRISTAVGDGITIDDVSNGLATVRVPRVTVQSDIPAGDWEFFLLLYSDGGSVFDELARGPFIVHPGRTS